jgi:hypothetical protein
VSLNIEKFVVRCNRHSALVSPWFGLTGLLSAVCFQYIVVQVCLADWLPPPGEGGGEIPDAVYRDLVEA